MLKKLLRLLLKEIGNRKKKIRNRKSSARNRRTKLPLAGYELLEPRQLLASVNVFSEFAGLLNPTDAVQQIAVSVAPNEVGSGRDRAVLGFRVSARDGNDFDPAALQIYSADGSVVTPKYSRSDLLGSTDSLVVAELDGGHYRLDVSGEVGAFSQFRTEVFLVGDVDGDHQVDRNDLDAIRSRYGARVGSSEYLVSADANLDGRITGFDLSMARRNENYSRSLNEPVFASAQAGFASAQADGVATANRVDSVALVAVSSDEGLLADNTNDGVAGVTPQEGFDPDAPMRFFESETSWVQPFASATSAGSAVYANSDGSVHSFDWLSRSAGYNNSLFVYKVDDASGTIGGISPIEASADAYRAEAQLNTERVFSPGQVPNGFDGHEIETPTIPNDWKFFSFYVVQNGDNYKWFPFDKVNVDGYEHFQATATGFKVEDLSGDPDPEKFPNPQGYVNDFDYNDIVFAVWRWDVGLDLDVDIDSDNNNGGGLPDRSRQEDILETESTGKVILANIQDRDQNGILDFIEGYNRDGLPNTEDDISAIDIDQLVIELPEYVDLDTYAAEDIEITFSYRANDPTQVYDDAEGNPLLPSGDGLVRLWAREISRNANVVSAGAAGDYIAPGTYTWADLQSAAIDLDSSTGLTLRLHVEGITPSATAGDQTITVSVSVPEIEESSQDSVVLTVGSIDLKIDGLDETLEDSPGAIIWRNSDFSKQLSSEDQPFETIGKYDPDWTNTTYFDPGYFTDYTFGTVTLADWMLDSYEIEFSINDSSELGSNLKLWSLLEWSGMETATKPDGFGSYWSIPESTKLTPATNVLYFMIEGIQSSVNFSADWIEVAATPVSSTAPMPEFSDRVGYTVIETGIGVDGNRDTEVDFENSFDRQLTFWYNDDREGTSDGKLPGEASFETEVFSDTSPADFEDDRINQRRDLEDLAYLQIEVGKLLVSNSVDTFTDGDTTTPNQLKTSYRFILENNSGTEIKIYNAVGDTAGEFSSIDHVRDKFSAFIQTSDEEYFEAVATLFSVDQIEIENDGFRGFLFEAFNSSADTPTLVFEVEVEYANGQKTIKSQEITLNLHPFEDFYTRKEIAYKIGDTDLRSDTSFAHFATPSGSMHSSQVLAAPFMDVRPFDEAETIVLLHGWNNTDGRNNIGSEVTDWKKATAETAFKRLYWQGVRGHFIEFDWPTFADVEGPRTWPDQAVNATYNISEYQAWRSGKALMETLEGISGKKQLLAHSMGNVVAAEALRQWSVENPGVNLVDSYVAMEAAMSSGVYGIDSTDAFTIHGPWWDTDLSQTQTSSDHDLYRHWLEGRHSDDQSSSYYMQGAASAAGNWVNFYNPLDLATNQAWRFNNLVKSTINQETPQLPGPYDSITDFFFPNEIITVNALIPDESLYPFRYVFTSEEVDGEPQNRYYRVEKTTNMFGDEIDNLVEISAGLEDPMIPGGVGPNGYEIIAFMSQANAPAVGNLNLPEVFHVNIDIRGLIAIQELYNDFSTHSFQFNHDSSTTWNFWEQVTVKSGMVVTR